MDKHNWTPNIGRYEQFRGMQGRNPGNTNWGLAVDAALVKVVSLEPVTRDDTALQTSPETQSPDLQVASHDTYL